MRNVFLTTPGQAGYYHTVQLASNWNGSRLTLGHLSRDLKPASVGISETTSVTISGTCQYWWKRSLTFPIWRLKPTSDSWIYVTADIGVVKWAEEWIICVRMLAMWYPTAS
jgi:hypothetical protein